MELDLRPSILANLAALGAATTCEVAARLGVEHHRVQVEMLLMHLEGAVEFAGRRSVSGRLRPAYRASETIGECEWCGTVDHHLVMGECPGCREKTAGRAAAAEGAAETALLDDDPTLPSLLKRQSS